MLAAALLCAATTIAAWCAWRELGGRAGAHLLTHAAAALLAAAGAHLVFDLEPDAALRLGALATVCLAIARIDGRLMIIPDVLVAATLALALLPPVLPLTEIATGAAVMAALFWGVRLIHAKMRGVEGLGLGDVKLAAAMGAHLGVEAALLATAVAAALTAAWIVATQSGRTQPAPFGVGLATALVVVAGFGP